MAGLVALFPLIHLIMGLFMLFAPLALDVEGDPGPVIVGWMFVIFAGTFMGMGWAFAGCVIAAGRCLTRRTHRLFCLIMAGVKCIYIPFRTVLGVFTIIVLMRESMVLAFEEAKEWLPGIPLSASNIWHARASVGLGGRARVCRFDAPSKDSTNYARMLIERSNIESDSDDQVVSELVPGTASTDMYDAARLKRAYGLSECQWMDSETIEHGLTGRGPPQGRSALYIRIPLLPEPDRAGRCRDLGATGWWIEQTRDACEQMLQFTLIETGVPAGICDGLRHAGGRISG